MTQEDIALILAVIGGACLATAWIGRLTGDAVRDVWLALGTGSVVLAFGALVLVA
ncbi:hypothetical protein GCM10028796_01800 [Ramlibacter monticola]|uniref:Uncharacterized protein n=1 Tax=Ramlibacter monticola TaxID=1926872 RepID=A0A936YYZ3_9BURK|nr:hypothetical protein [Ramlibacter monticola]MBL0391528.1 hypothetical protein [Ramlibacter monticola]